MNAEIVDSNSQQPSPSKSIPVHHHQTN